MTSSWGPSKEGGHQRVRTNTRGSFQLQKQHFEGAKIVHNILIQAYKMGWTPNGIFAEFAELERDGVDLLQANVS